MFKYIRGSLPILFNDYCIRNVDMHSHVIRQQHELHTYKYAPQKYITCYHKVCYDVSCTYFKMKAKLDRKPM